jgi:hypothetical protein
MFYDTGPWPVCDVEKKLNRIVTSATMSDNMWKASATNAIDPVT